MEQALEIMPDKQNEMMTAMTANQIKMQVQLIQQIMRDVMKENEHYGKIPGCGDKNALFKSGAEKLNLTFRFDPDFQVEPIDMGGGHREYRVKCVMYSIITGRRQGSGVGSCSTMEAKYRYRTGPVEFTGRPVPKAYWDLRNSDPKKALELLGGKGFVTKKNDGGGWEIAKQGERVEHDNPADHYNTVLKMAKKRAMVDAVLTVTAASDIFTQDIEEMIEEEPAPKADSAKPAEGISDEEFNRLADQALAEEAAMRQDQKATVLCLCGVKLSDKAVQYYKDNPTREKICYDCNQLKKASKPYGKDRQREAGEEG